MYFYFLPKALNCQKLIFQLPEIRTKNCSPEFYTIDYTNRGISHKYSEMHCYGTLQTHTHPHPHSHPHPCTHIHIHTPTPTPTHTHPHTHSYTHSHTHLHTFTPTPTPTPTPPLPHTHTQSRLIVALIGACMHSWVW